MLIHITAEEALDRGIWEELCDLKGINVWAVNEGLMGTEDLIVLSEEEAETLRLIKDGKICL